MEIANIIIGISGLLLTGTVIYLTINYNKKRRIDVVVENYATNLNTQYDEFGIRLLKKAGICELNNDNIVKVIERITKRTGRNPLTMDQSISEDDLAELYKKKDIAGILSMWNGSVPLKDMIKKSE